MQDGCNGKLMVYGSSFAYYEKRLKSVSLATEKIARMLNLNFEIVTFVENVTSIYVYYKDGDEEPIPIYCSKDGKTDMHEICGVLRNMIFVLSFHPKHSALRQIRKDIMQLS